MRVPIAPGEYYHICNRGIGRQAIFHESRDYQRFLFLILYFQSRESFPNLSRTVDDFVQHPMLNIAKDVIEKRDVELVAFCIMPNHFHLLVKEIKDKSLASYVQRICNSYGKYHNIKYGKSGHVFQGAYRSVHMESDEQLKYASAYIHKNPREIVRWKSQYMEYPYSSLQDVVGDNRWGELIVPEILLGDMQSRLDYKKFVETSPAKAYEEELSLLQIL